MTVEPQQDTLVILKPDAFWRGLTPQIETRLGALGLEVVAECTLAGDQNLPVEKWKEFYFPAIGNRPHLRHGYKFIHPPAPCVLIKGSFDSPILVSPGYLLIPQG